MASRHFGATKQPAPTAIYITQVLREGKHVYGTVYPTEVYLDCMQAIAMRATNGGFQSHGKR